MLRPGMDDARGPQARNQSCETRKQHLIGKTKHAIGDQHNAQQAEEFGILGRLFRNWQSRRKVASLQELDDYLLDDIGVSAPM